MSEPRDAPDPPHWLCHSEALTEAGLALVFDVTEFGRPVRAFALRHQGAAVAYLNRCAHVPAELDWQPGQFMDADRAFILCSIHGASYEPLTGRCAGGPCGRGRLTAITLTERNGDVYWYPSATIKPVPGTSVV
jgi:nitrite reductase/ring-hydroxylating ferredoxin subunit